MRHVEYKWESCKSWPDEALPSTKTDNNLVELNIIDDGMHKKCSITEIHPFFNILLLDHTINRLQLEIHPYNENYWELLCQVFKVS